MFNIWQQSEDALHNIEEGLFRQFLEGLSLDVYSRIVGTRSRPLFWFSKAICLSFRILWAIRKYFPIMAIIFTQIPENSDIFFSHNGKRPTLRVGNHWLKVLDRIGSRMRMPTYYRSRVLRISQCKTHVGKEITLVSQFSFLIRISIYTLLCLVQIGETRTKSAILCNAIFEKLSIIPICMLEYFWMRSRMLPHIQLIANSHCAKMS